MSTHHQRFQSIVFSGLIVLCLLVILPGRSFSRDILYIEKVTSFPLFWENITEYQIQDSILYGVGRITGLRIRDLHNPANPVEIGNCADARLRSVIVDGEYAYGLADSTLNSAGTKVLAAYSIADPGRPALIGEFPIDWRASRIEKEGDFLYVVRTQDAIYIVDITQPSNPHLFNWLQIEPPVDDFTIQNNHLFVSSSNILQVFNLSDPGYPVFIDSVTVEGGIGNLNADGNTLLSSFPDHIDTYDISDPSNVTLRNSIDVEEYGTIHLSGDRLILSRGDITVLDVSQPDTVIQVAIFESDYNVRKVFGDLLIMGLPIPPYQQPVPFAITDISEIEGPELIYESPQVEDRTEEYGAITVAGDVCYLTSYQYNLEKPLTIDVSDPNHPEIIGEVFGNRLMNRIKVEGDLLFGSYRDSFLTYDISNPTEPVFLDSVVADTILNYDYHDGFVYIWSGIAGQGVFIDIIDATNPEILHSVGRLEGRAGIAIQDNLLYTLHASNLYIYEINNPGQPELINIVDEVGLNAEVLPTSNAVSSLVDVGHYVATTIRIVDTSNPLAPQILESFGRYPSSWFNPYVFPYSVPELDLITVGYGTKYDIINLSEPMNPSEFPELRSMGACKAVDYQDGYLYALNSPFLEIYTIEREEVTVEDQTVTSPSEFKLHQPFPNPFNSTCEIRFEIPRSEQVNLKLYDILGREVMNLVDQKLEHGSHTYMIDGSGLSSGIYFVAINARKFKTSQKILLLK
ncbi:T9SS type A sorting domain-containing protein [bacterium]|nr:T9SS type A sorting domain-containing protein [bacterium]